MRLAIREVLSGTPEYEQLLATADALQQRRYVLMRPSYAERSILLGAFLHNECVGFLHFLIQVIGSDMKRPPIYNSEGEVLREGYIEAFGVLELYRRQGIGQTLQEYVLNYCADHGCYQVRSRSPVTSRENYALKLKMGYAIHPSNENDSYYFIKTLV
jgi:Acetyltransferase (GNAT) family.